MVQYRTCLVQVGRFDWLVRPWFATLAAPHREARWGRENARPPAIRSCRARRRRADAVITPGGFLAAADRSAALIARCPSVFRPLLCVLFGASFLCQSAGARTADGWRGRRGMGMQRARVWPDAASRDVRSGAVPPVIFRARVGHAAAGPLPPRADAQGRDTVQTVRDDSFTIAYSN